jgi:hypothetical protein
MHRLSTGCQWRQLPARFGPWQTMHKRHMLWSADGTWEQLIQHAQAIADEAGDTDWNINVDSTSIRAHQHAAGAPTNPPSPSSACGYATPSRRSPTSGAKPPPTRSEAAIPIAMTDLMARRLTGEDTILARPDTADQPPGSGVKRGEKTTSQPSPGAVGRRCLPGQVLIQRHRDTAGDNKRFASAC